MGNLKDLTDEIVVFDQDSESKGFKILVVVTVNKHAEEVLSQLRKMEFERFEFLGLSGKPDELIGKSQSELESIAREKESILNQLADISAEWFEELRALKEELEIEKQRNEVFSSFGETEKKLFCLKDGFQRKKTQKRPFNH